jgi:hypothetical protein
MKKENKQTNIKVDYLHTHGNKTKQKTFFFLIQTRNQLINANF